MPSQCRAVIDIGSNSIKLIVAEKQKNNQIKILESLRNVVPLGKNTFFKERINQDNLNTALFILENYQKVLQQYNITSWRVIATTAIREASNRDLFIDTVFRRTGFKVEILTAGDVVYYIDNYLSYILADRYPIHDKNLLIAEIGEGSMDISFMQKGYAMMNLGLPIGILRLQQLACKISGSLTQNYYALEEYIDNEFRYLKRILPEVNFDDVMIIDETYSCYLENMLGNFCEEKRLFSISQENIEGIYNILKNKTYSQISHEYNLTEDIAEGLVYYLIILKTILNFAQKDYLYIFQSSLAEAVLFYELFGLEESSEYVKMKHLVSVARFICRRFRLDLAHAQQVAEYCQTIFKALHSYLGLDSTSELYLILAAYLHDLGMFIHNRAHHKHTEYIIKTFNLFRLSEEEINTIACIARYHRRPSPMSSHSLYMSLPPGRRIIVQKLSAILKIANALDRAHRQKVRELEVVIENREEIKIIVHTGHNFLLEKADFLEKKSLFEEITGNRLSLIIKP